MSAITTLDSVRSRTAGPLHFLRSRVGAWGLIIALLALPVYYGLHDLTPRVSDGLRSTGTRSSTTTSRSSASTSLEGLSNGAVWALIAIGYTLVYGIIELINFAHGDVFMIGSFTSSRCGARSGSRSPPGRSA